MKYKEIVKEINVHYQMWKGQHDECPECMPDERFAVLGMMAAFAMSFINNLKIIDVDNILAIDYKIKDIIDGNDAIIGSTYPKLMNYLEELDGTGTEREEGD